MASWHLRLLLEPRLCQAGPSCATASAALQWQSLQVGVYTTFDINARWHINVAQFLCSTPNQFTCKETWPNSILRFLRWKCTFLLLLYILAWSEYVPCLKTHSLSCFSKQLSSTKWLVDIGCRHALFPQWVVLPASPTHVRKPGKFRKRGFGSPQRGLPTRDLGPAPHLVTCDMWHVLTCSDGCLSSKVLPVLTCPYKKQVLKSLDKSKLQ
jgi:hypothetical protein